MSDVQLLAKALLLYAQEPEIAGLLLSEAVINDAVTWTAEIPAAQLIAEKAGPVARVISIAQSTKDPAVLAVLAKDTRVTVAHAVASNRNLDEATARKIHDRANAKDRPDILAAVLPSISTTDLLAARPGSAITWPDFPAYEIVKRYPSGGGPWPRADIEAMLGTDNDQIATRALKACYDGECPNLSVTEAADLVTHHLRTRCIAHVLTQSAAVNLELAQLYRANRTEVFRGIGYTAGVNRTWDVDAANAVFDEITLDELKFMVRHDLDPANIARAVDLVEQFGDSESHRFMLLANAKQLTAQQTSRLLAPIGNPFRSSGEHSPQDFTAIITAITVEISTADMVRVMSAATPPLITYWAGGTYGRHKPRRGEISTIMSNAPHDHDGTRMEAAKLAAKQFELFIDNEPIVDEFVDSLGRWILPYMKTTPLVAKYTAARFHRVFGTDRELWNTAVRLADGWNGSLGDLMDVAFLTTGRQPPPREIEHDIVLLPSPETADGQLCLAW